MSFTTGNVGFTRFKVRGPKPRMFDAEHLDRLRAFAAGRQKAAADGIETGWAAGKHIRDTDFTLDKNVYPDHLLFDLWVQTNRLPKERLRAYYEIDLKALVANNPSGFPSARQRREAKESARERLEQEGKDGRYLKWQMVPVAWDLGTNTVFFGSASRSAMVRFTTLFAKTFEGHLYQPPVTDGLEFLSAGRVALNADPQAKGSMLSHYLPGTTPDEVAWLADSESLDFLGNEFLLWLWYQGDSETETLTLPDDTRATFMFSGGVKVECPRGQSGDDTMNHEGPTRLPEARRAIQSGKLPRKAGLVVVRNDDQFALHLQAETFAVSRCKLPKPDAAIKDAREILMHRLQATRDVAETLDLMYARFLSVRLSADWAGEMEAMRRWLNRAERMAA